MVDSYDSSESDDSYYTAESEEEETIEEIYKQINRQLETHSNKKMADSYDSSESDDSYYTAESEEEETVKKIYIRERFVPERKEKTSKCESCVSKRIHENVAVFLCFVCEVYLCVNCRLEHKSHEGMEVWRKESERQIERKGKQNERNITKKQVLLKKLKAENERKRKIEEKDREQCEREKMLENFVDKIMKESEIERKNELKNSHAVYCDQVEVKHKLDGKNNCWIFGLCGLKNRGWVVCDFNNSCIKIFKLGSNILQRYIVFVSSAPWDVTEIDLKPNFTEPNLVSGSSSDISATDQGGPNEQYLIAVTLPWNCQIMFLDLSEKPAKTQKVIKTDGECYSIQCYDDKIFTVCKKHLGFGSVYVLSTEGDKLNMFYTGNCDEIPLLYLAAVSGRVYLTDQRNDKVQCRNVEGQVMTEITIKGSRPVGISVDPDNNVYVCTLENNKVYKLDADLTRYKSVLDQTAGYIEHADALCYYRHKLFISHGGSRRNFVTVVRLL